MNIANFDSESSDMQETHPVFEDLYHEVRRREKRLYSDGQLMFLPDIDSSHVHYKEWQIRKRSSQKLIDYLAKKNMPLNILEIGCGNGWLSSRLSSIKNSKVIGLDINELEILQAKRVFKKDNLEFICGSFTPAMFPGKKFDVILFAASLQYFSLANDILQQALTFLTDKGEVHIIDTPFYSRREIDGAMLRAKEYFAMLDCPEMAAYYFYHTLNDLKLFNHRVLANPSGVINRLNKRHPFYWIAITH
jgi:ubiquinone/menaquinone biosynthesis C-methylase UbiE